MNIRPVGDGLLHAGGQTDRHDEANRRFSQVCDRTTQEDLLVKDV